MPESVVREKANSHTASSFGWELSLTNTRVDTPCDPGKEEVACQCRGQCRGLDQQLYPLSLSRMSLKGGVFGERKRSWGSRTLLDLTWASSLDPSRWAGSLSEPFLFQYHTECVSGCVCPDGLLDDGRGNCVVEDNCTCIHNKRLYSSGEGIKLDCNNTW